MNLLAKEVDGGVAEALGMLRTIPDAVQEGFLNVIEHMGSFSGVFAAGANRATSGRERIESADEFGLAPLRGELRRLLKESRGVFDAFATMMRYDEQFSGYLARLNEWGFALEQEAFLPSIVDQIRRRGEEWLETQTVGSVVDNLMQQMRPLIHEMVANGQQAEDAMKSLTRRLVADVAGAQHGTTSFRRGSDASLRQLGLGLQEVRAALGEMEERSSMVSTEIFSMMQAMQYDDITSQRLHHAIEALERVREKIAREGLGPETSRWLVVALRIVIDQLGETGADLVTAVQSIHVHLTRIADQSVAQVRGVTAVRRASIGMRSSVGDLGYHLGALLRLGIFDEGLAGEVLRAISQAENAVFQAKRIVNVLVATAKRMRNLAGAVRTRGNDRLEIVVASTRDLAQRICEQGPGYLETLTAAASLLRGLSMEYAERTTPRLVLTNSMLRRLPLSNQQVESNVSDLLATIGETMGEAQAANIQIMLLTAELNFHTSCKRLMDKTGQGLGRVIDRLVAAGVVVAGEGDPSQWMAEFEDLAALYTMASERRVHQSALTEETEAADGEEGDNFELF